MGIDDFIERSKALISEEVGASAENIKLDILTYMSGYIKATFISEHFNGQTAVVIRSSSNSKVQLYYKEEKVSGFREISEDEFNESK